MVFLFCSFVNPDYETQACTGSAVDIPGHDRKCAPCKTTCPATSQFPNNRIVQACDLYSDAICLSEIVCTCPAGNYISVPCIQAANATHAVANAVCKPVTAKCAGNFYKVSLLLSPTILLLLVNNTDLGLCKKSGSRCHAYERHRLPRVSLHLPNWILPALATPQPDAGTMPIRVCRMHRVQGTFFLEDPCT